MLERNYALEVGTAQLTIVVQTTDHDPPSTVWRKAVTELFKEQLGEDFVGPERRRTIYGPPVRNGGYTVYYIPVSSDCRERTPIVERVKKRLRRLMRGNVKFTYDWSVNDPWARIAENGFDDMREEYCWSVNELHREAR